MATVLNFNTLAKELAAEEDIQTDKIFLPEFIDGEKFSLFERILQARTPEEIEDISVDDILGIFPNLGDYCNIICFDNIVSPTIGEKMQKYRSSNSRRII